ncbi:MAG: winged helix-turn-helix domain-containing protein [Dehalococcoidia bacterium]
MSRAFSPAAEALISKAIDRELKLLDVLQANPGARCSDLARLVGTTWETTRSRLMNLISAGLARGEFMPGGMCYFAEDECCEY